MKLPRQDFYRHSLECFKNILDYSFHRNSKREKTLSFDAIHLFFPKTVLWLNNGHY